jgi:hypothetical protein
VARAGKAYHHTDQWREETDADREGRADRFAHEREGGTNRERRAGGVDVVDDRDVDRGIAPVGERGAHGHG